MSDTLWILLLVTLATAAFLQDKYKTQSLEEEKNLCFEQNTKRAIEADQLKQQVTQIKEHQHETDRESRKYMAKIAAMEEKLEKLEDERNEWEDERDRLQLREKHSKQQQDKCRSQLKAADSAITEEKIKRLRTETDLEELRKESLLCSLNTITQQVLLEKALNGALKTEEFPTTGNTDYKTNPVLVKKFKTKAALEENHLIMGIAKLNDDIFAVTADSNIIERFDSSTLSSKEQMFLSGYENLQDVKPCNRSELLFVIDKDDSTGKIFIASVDPYNKKIVKFWSVDSCVSRFSVTEDCHVITVCSDKNKMNEYAPNGQLIREIVLKQEMGILNPRYALKMTDGNFLLSYDGTSSWTGICLAILNSKGEVLKFYRAPSKEPEFVNAMAIDRLGNVLVAEMMNGRVLLFSSDLEYKRELVSRDYGIGFISDLFLDEVNGRIFVVDCSFNVQGNYFENGRILVFDMY